VKLAHLVGFITKKMLRCTVTWTYNSERRSLSPKKCWRTYIYENMPVGLQFWA